MPSKALDTFPDACPQCGGEVYDNRPKKAAREGNYNAKSQDWTCKDTGCRDGQYRSGGWVKAEDAPPPPTTGRAAPVAERSWQTMEARYSRCQHIALRRYSKKWALENPQAYAAVVAHFSITANQWNLPVAGPQTAPAPTPPEPEDDYPPLPEEDDEGLPF